MGEMAEKIGIEERKLMIAQRKLESIRILDELLERVKATNKPKEDLLGKGLQDAAAAKKGSRVSKKKEASVNLTAKEKEIREMLELKKKAEDGINRQKIKVNRAKNDDFESVSDDDLSDEINVSNDEMEEVSEDNRNDSDSDNSSEIDSDEELRLTSTDEDSDDDRSRKKRKKDKKDKKRRDNSRDRGSRKQREIERQVRLA